MKQKIAEYARICVNEPCSGTQNFSAGLKKGLWKIEEIAITFLVVLGLNIGDIKMTEIRTSKKSADLNHIISLD